MTNEINTTTGLPALPADQFWRVERLDYRGRMGATHRLVLMRKRDRSFKTWWADLARPAYLKEGKSDKRINARDIERSEFYSEYDKEATEDVHGLVTHSPGWAKKVSDAQEEAETKLAEWAPYSVIKTYESEQSIQFRVVDTETRPELIRIKAQDILLEEARGAIARAEAAAEEARLAVYEGDYPPKKLGA